MWKISIVASPCGIPGLDSAGECSPGFAGRSLPVSYLSDYSVIGLKVDRTNIALGIIEALGFHIQDAEWGWELILEDPSHLPKIVDTLSEQGVSSQIANLVECVYQG